MVCDLEPTYNFLFEFFLCTLPEDTINVDLTIHTLKGIHTFREDRKTQISRCSPWGMEVKPFLSLWKKMKDYIEECQVIANPLTNRSFPSRTKPSPFAKRPKATPVIRSNPVTRYNIGKFSKPRKVNVGYHARFLQWIWFAIKAKEVEAITQVPHIPNQLQH